MPADSERTIYVVFAAAALYATGLQLAHQIVAVQEDLASAEALAARYRALAEAADPVSMRVFTQRYTLPYAAPAVRDLTGKG